MTVINMMSFGSSGAAIADEQASTHSRKYNMSMKLRLLDGSTIYGGSGGVQFIKEIYDLVGDHIEEIRKKQTITPELIYEVTKKVSADLKNSARDKYLMDNFGITFEELQTGVKQKGSQLDDAFKAKAYQNLEGNPHFNGSITASVLLGGLCNGKFEIFYLDTEGGQSNKRFIPYGTIGSGADESDKVLSRFYTEMSRKKREQIPVQEGLVKLIEATNASARLNVGVGGIPSIVYLNGDGVKEPSENQSILASELVEGFVRDFLDRDFVYNAVEDLVLRGVDFETLEEEMKKQAKDWKQLDRVLRGYK